MCSRLPTTWKPTARPSLQTQKATTQPTAFQTVAMNGVIPTLCTQSALDIRSVKQWTAQCIFIHLHSVQQQDSTTLELLEKISKVSSEMWYSEATLNRLILISTLSL